MAIRLVLVDIPMGKDTFRVLAVLVDHPHPVGRFPCRVCKRQDVPTWSRRVDTVRKLNSSTGLFELVMPDTADHDLAANTFRREYLEAGPLCEDCFARTVSGGRAPEEDEARRVQP